MRSQTKWSQSATPAAKRVARLAAIVALATFGTSIATGCGPVLSTYLILSAQAELDGAKAAEAEKYAPYYYTASEQYLAKAREEQGYADFGPSVEYAWKAKDHAEEARERADLAKKNATPPEQAPATEIDMTPAPRTAVPPTKAPVIIRKTPEGGTQ